MAVRVRLHIHPRRGEGADLGPAHDRPPGRLALLGGGDPAAEGPLEILPDAAHAHVRRPLDRRAHGVDGQRRIAARVERPARRVGELDRLGAGPVEQERDLVPPEEPPRVGVRRGDEERRLHPRAAQDRQREPVVVGVAVVEGEQHRVRRDPPSIAGSGARPRARRSCSAPRAPRSAWRAPRARPRSPRGSSCPRRRAGRRGGR